MNKKIIAIANCFIMLSSTLLSSGATYINSPNRTDAVCIREDIPIEIAVNQNGYNASLEIPVTHINSRATHWDVWGERNNNIPYGYSQQMNGSTVLNTKHYTRTFLGSKLDPRGDSGQVWGIGLVPASGTYCSGDVWLSYTQKLYYGTTKK